MPTFKEALIGFQDGFTNKSYLVVLVYFSIPFLAAALH